MTELSPPRWAARLLEAVLPPTDRSAAILGDLHEEFALRARHDLGAARRWYVREAFSVGLRYAGQTRKYTRRRERLAARTTTNWEGFVDGLVLNIRYAVRRLLRAPAFTLVAVLSLGLGIGANTAIFSLVNAVIIRDLPFDDVDRLVDVYQAQEGFSHGTLSYPDYADIRDASDGVFTEVGGTQLIFLQVDADQGVEVVPAEAVTGNYFELLGVQAALGRMLTEEDHVSPGGHPVVVLSHRYWERNFASDPEIVGTEMRLAGRPYTVIGVAPEDYPGTIRGLEPDAFVPIMMYDDLQGSVSGAVLEARGNQSFFGKARLAPGVTFAEAEALVDRMTVQLREDYPLMWTSDESFVLEPTADVIMNPMIDRFIIPAAGMIMVVVGLVLLIACANLASFLLARAADRRKEIAVRLAMGAQRRTLIGQLLTETVLLSALGGIAGVLLARESLRMLATADLSLPLPITLDLSLDGVVLSFSLLVSIGAGLLFGLAPALQSTNPDVAPTLRDESAGGGRSKSAALRNLLVVGQVSVSVVLLVAAGLFLRSLDASRSIDPGFGDAPTGILTINTAASRYTDEEGRLFMEDLRDRIGQIPGVQSVGFIDNLHMNPLSTQNVRVTVDGVDPPVGQDFHMVDVGRADEGFLDAAGIPLIEGRGFDLTDEADGQPVAMVTEEFVRRFFPSGNAVGRTIVLNGVESQVIGVTADHKVRQLGEDLRPFVYRNHRQAYSRFVTILARTSGDAEALSVEMLRTARSLDPELMVLEAKSMDRHMATMLIGRELGALVVGGFALLALILASIGLYGVVSYAVSRRAKEVGIRLSLGADASSVVRMLTKSGMTLVAIGAAIGLLIAAALAQLLSRLLYGVPPLDVATFLGVPLVLGVVALLAAWIPARRATRIDPVGSLRAE